MITREKCLELARATGTPYVNRHYPGVTSFGFTEETLESLVRSSVCLGMEMAAKKMESGVVYTGGMTGVAMAIRKLAEEVQRD